jgi:hypothetical protein
MFVSELNILMIVTGVMQFRILVIEINSRMLERNILMLGIGSLVFESEILIERERPSKPPATTRASPPKS